MQPRIPKVRRARLKRDCSVAAGAARHSHDESVQADVRADEDDPSRLAPSAEGVVTFSGLPSKVREWLERELRNVGRKRHESDGEG